MAGIFRVCDVRRRYPEELNEAEARGIGTAVRLEPTANSRDMFAEERQEAICPVQGVDAAVVCSSRR